PVDHAVAQLVAYAEQAVDAGVPGSALVVGGAVAVGHVDGRAGFGQLFQPPPARTGELLEAGQEVDVAAVRDALRCALAYERGRQPGPPQPQVRLLDGAEAGL